MVLQVSNRPISNLPFELLNLILDYTIPPRLFLNPSFSLGPNSALSLTMRQMKSRVLVCKIWWDVHILAKQGNVVGVARTLLWTRNGEPNNFGVITSDSSLFPLPFSTYTRRSDSSKEEQSS